MKIITTQQNEPKNHLVLCGWKQEMDMVVKEILLVNTQLKSEDILIIAKINKSYLNSFEDDPLLSGVQFILGDPFSDETLEMASVQTASKVIVLADWANKSESATETDAKTLMAIMAVEKKAPFVYLVAELLDPSFLVYFKMANVDEIIFSREYSRILLANSVSSGGIGHVLYTMLSKDGHSRLATVNFPAEFIGRTFGELYDYYNQNTDPRAICIGLLENIGNLAILKRQALVEAQKFPEMRTILSHLKNIKDLENNCPKLNPGHDYMIMPNSMSIIIGDYREFSHIGASTISSTQDESKKMKLLTNLIYGKGKHP